MRKEARVTSLVLWLALLAAIAGTALDTWLIFNGRLTLPDWGIITAALVGGVLIATGVGVVYSATLKGPYEQ